MDMVSIYFTMIGQELHFLFSYCRKLSFFKTLKKEKDNTENKWTRKSITDWKLGITLIYEKKLIVKIHSHVNVFSHGLKLLVKSCSHGTKLIVKFCVHVTRYIITKSSCRDEMNFNWSQIVNFYGINRGKTHSLSQSIPVVRGWDIVSFTNGKESYRLKIDEWGLDNVSFTLQDFALLIFMHYAEMVTWDHWEKS